MVSDGAGRRRSRTRAIMRSACAVLTWKKDAAETLKGTLKSRSVWES